MPSLSDELEKQIVNVFKLGMLDATCGRDKSSPMPAIKEIHENILALFKQYARSERLKIVAQMQSEIVDPAIDKDFGTIDYKVVAENTLNFIENELSQRRNV